MEDEDDFSPVEFEGNHYYWEDYEYFCDQEARESAERLKSHSGKKSLTITTNLTFDSRQSVCKELSEGAKLLLVREPDSNYDLNAIGVLFEGKKCGYIREKLAREIAKNYSEINLQTVVINVFSKGDFGIGVDIRIRVTFKNNSKESSEKRILSREVKNWIDEKDQSEFTEEQAKSAFELTDEQKEIVAQDLFGNSTMKIIAFAGTGKTATLLEYAKRRPNLRFLYVAFNKSVQKEAERKFPSNVLCKTSHSLAWPEFGAPHARRLVKSLKPSTVKDVLGLHTYMEAKIVTETLLNFLISADAKFSRDHLPWLSAHETGRPISYLEMAAKLWILMCDPTNEDVGMLHDGYLKQYQLSKPLLNYECILLDEAQDTNPVITDIILSQNCPKILVGDPHQQIYAFRGAQDAMQRIETDKTFYLTYSFRFGEEIAWIANKILHTFKNEKQSLKGFRSKSSNEEPKDLAIISRTNASVFDQAVAHCESKKISFLGGIDGYRFNDIIDVYLLYARKNSEIKNPFIRSFSSYSDMIAYAEEAQDWEMRSNCKVVEKYQDRIPFLIDKIKTSAVDRLDSDVVLTTAHKAKGAQFSKIKLCDDFPDFFHQGQLVDRVSISVDEFNLMYVAVTRSRESIDFDAAESWAKFIALGNRPGYEKMLAYFGLDGNACSFGQEILNDSFSSPAKIKSYNDIFLDDKGVERLNQIIRLSQEDRLDAETQLEDLMKKYPKSPQLWISMSIIRPAKHLFEKQDCYFKAIEVDPAFYDGHRRLAQGIRASAFRMSMAPAAERLDLVILLLQVQENLSACSSPLESAGVISTYPQLFTDDWQERYDLSLKKMKEGLTLMDHSRYPQELLDQFEDEYRLYATLSNEVWPYVIYFDYHRIMI